MTNAIQALNEVERRLRTIDLPGVQIIGLNMALIALSEYRQELTNTSFSNLVDFLPEWESMDAAIAAFEADAIEAMRREEDEYHEAQLEAEAEKQAQDDAWRSFRAAGRPLFS